MAQTKQQTKQQTAVVPNEGQLAVLRAFVGSRGVRVTAKEQRGKTVRTAAIVSAKGVPVPGAEKITAQAVDKCERNGWLQPAVGRNGPGVGATTDYVLSDAGKAARKAGGKALAAKAAGK